MTGILNLPGLLEVDMKELEFEYHVKAEPAAISRLCPNCGEMHRADFSREKLSPRLYALWASASLLRWEVALPYLNANSGHLSVFVVIE